ncbi:hypothetical protein [Pasteurella canis]|uniref:hypothetical protein n=1 Tax=Pasteurella canis TaxID=753 RepID=UPI001CBE7C7C|nr:hypothetical protein [Pasteurella canis]UAX42501.1 hypothetical protein K7G89_000321 [Pasteurella canis]
MSAIPLTKAESIQERMFKARFMKEINAFYLNALNKDLDDLEKVDTDLSYALRGILLAYQNNHQSIEYWDKAIKINPSAEHYYNYGMSLQYLGLHDKSLSMFRLALDNAKNNIGLLRLLRTAFSSFYASDECKAIIEKLSKLDKEGNYPFYENDILMTFFKGDSEIMLSFGLNMMKIISQYYSLKWLIHTEDRKIDDRYYSKQFLKCFSDDDVIRLVECNSALADFIVDFEEQYDLDLSHFYVCCEAAE